MGRVETHGRGWLAYVGCVVKVRVSPMPATWCDWARTRRRGLRRSPHYLKQAAHVHAYDPAAAAVSIETEPPSHLDCGAPEFDRWVDRVAAGGGVLVVRGAACVWQETWAGARKHGPRRQQPGRCCADRLGLERGDDGRRRRADVRALHFGGARGPANCNSALRLSDSLPGTHGNPPNKHRVVVYNRSCQLWSAVKTSASAS